MHLKRRTKSGWSISQPIFSNNRPPRARVSQSRNFIEISGISDISTNFPNFPRFFGQLTYDTPISGVPLTTRQPVETCRYRVSQYHTPLSHILRPIPTYLISNIQKYMIYYLINNPFTSPFIQQKGIHVLLEYNT